MDDRRHHGQKIEPPLGGQADARVCRIQNTMLYGLQFRRDI
jgi:hypothetical protein